MLNPQSPSKKVSNNFVVCDIENFVDDPSNKKEWNDKFDDGQVIGIDTCFRSDGHLIEHVRHDDWVTWWGWLKRQAKRDKKYRTVFAHNGGGWDWLSFLEWFIEHRNRRDAISCIVAGSNLIVLRINVSGRFIITLSDTLPLLRSSLDKLSKSILGTGKKKLSFLPHYYYFTDRNKFEEYFQTDTENLLLILESVIDLIRDNVCEIGSLGITIGSTAMKVFRQFLKYPVTIPFDQKLKDFLREGYKGGRVEVFQYGYFPEVKVYDINSLYPSVMRDTFVPVSDRGEWLDFIPSLENEEHCGTYRVRFRQKNKSKLPVLMVDGTGVYEGEGVYFLNELRLLKRIDPLAEIKVIEGFYFVDTDRIFSGYVNALYNLRMENKGEPLDLICKYLLNSLYGKFGQHPVRESIIVFSEGEEDLIMDFLKDGGRLSPLNDDDIFSVETDTPCNFEHVGIAGTITSESRVRLYEGFQNVDTSRIIYSDTDSLHCCGSLPDHLVGSSLGLWKEEFEGEGVYCGRKLYGLRRKDLCWSNIGPIEIAKEKVRSKGVSVGGRNGAYISFDHLCGISEGEEKVAFFNRATTFREVLYGKAKSCQFQKRHRTIRVT